MADSIPLVDLKLQHAEVAAEIEQGFARVMADGRYVLGREVQDFEEQFARYCGVRACVAVASGTDAIELALRAVGVGPDDEVVVPVNTFIATALAVSRAGARPVLVDCDERYHLIDPVEVEKRLGRRTSAIIAVHLYGQVAPMEKLSELARQCGASLVEDAAQAHGASRRGVHAGALATAAATSFYPGKNLGAYGDGGAVLVDSEEIENRLRALRNYGSVRKYEHPEKGFNSRLDTLQAVVLLAKLARLERWNQLRREAAARYDELLCGADGIETPLTMQHNVHAWHLYVVRTRDRDRVLGELHAAGIGASVHYPTPVHLHRAFQELGHGPGDFPNAERAAGEILSLPLFPGITPVQQESVAETLRRAVR